MRTLAAVARDELVERSSASTARYTVEAAGRLWRRR